jgi:hypothetical protein
MKNAEAVLVTSIEEDYVVKTLTIDGVLSQQIKYNAATRTTIIITVNDYVYTESVYSADNELIYYNKLDKIKAEAIQFIKDLGTDSLRMIA